MGGGGLLTMEFNRGVFLFLNGAREIINKRSRSLSTDWFITALNYYYCQTCIIIICKTQDAITSIYIIAVRGPRAKHGATNIFRL